LPFKVCPILSTGTVGQQPLGPEFQQNETCPSSRPAVTITVGTARRRYLGPGVGRAKIGSVIAAVFTAVILWFMLVASAATLGQQHQPVTSARDAAEALRPLAGPLPANFVRHRARHLRRGRPAGADGHRPPTWSARNSTGAAACPRRSVTPIYGLLTASIGLAVAVTLANISVIGMLVAASVIGGFGAHPSAW